MATKILIGKDTRLCIKKSGVYENIPGAQSLTYPSYSPDELEITQFATPGDFDSFQPGLISAGEFSLNMVYVGGLYNDFLTLMFNKSLNEFLIAFKNDTGYEEYTFKGYISSMPINDNVAEIINYDMTIQLTGQVNKNTGSSLLPLYLPNLVYGNLGKGTLIEISEDLGVNWKTIKYPTECNGPDFALSYEDITNFQTVGMVREQLPLTFSIGNFSVTSIAASGYDTDEVSYDELLGYAKTSKLLKARITYPTGEYWVATCYVMDLSKDVPKKGKKGLSFSLRITEQPSYAGSTPYVLLDSDVLNVITLIDDLPMPNDVTIANYTTYIADIKTAYQGYRDLTTEQKQSISYILVYKLELLKTQASQFYFSQNVTHYNWES